MASLALGARQTKKCENSKKTKKSKKSMKSTQCCAVRSFVAANAVAVWWRLVAVTVAIVLLAGQPTVIHCVDLLEKDAISTLYNVMPTDELGIYKYAYTTSNGISVQTAGSPIEIIGIYSYTSPEGLKFEVRYIADELGFHAVGRHLPRPPPIPDYIQRSLDYIRTHPNQENRIGGGKMLKSS